MDSVDQAFAKRWEQDLGELAKHVPNLTASDIKNLMFAAFLAGANHGIAESNYMLREVIFDTQPRTKQ